MTKSTVNLVGIGLVEIKTDLREVVLVGEIASTGHYVNCRTLKVRRNKLDAKAAEQNYGVYLKEVSERHFVVCDLPEYMLED